MTRTEVTDLLSKAKAVKAQHWVPMIPTKEDFSFIESCSPEAITRLAESYLQALEIINKIANKHYCRESGRYEDDSREFLRKIGET